MRMQVTFEQIIIMLTIFNIFKSCKLLVFSLKQKWSRKSTLSSYCLSSKNKQHKFILFSTRFFWSM